MMVVVVMMMAVVVVCDCWGNGSSCGAVYDVSDGANGAGSGSGFSSGD